MHCGPPNQNFGWAMAHPANATVPPMNFMSYINDLGKNICSTVLKFAENTKSDSVAKVDSSQAVNSLRRDLCSLAAWSEEWLGYCFLMLINVVLCILGITIKKDNVYWEVRI